MWPAADPSKPQGKLKFLRTDRVVVNITGKLDSMEKLLNGRTGVVVGHTVTFPNNVFIGIQFDDFVSPLLHDCHGAGQAGRCAYVAQKYVELIK